MAYVGLAETAAISAQLPNHPHMLLLLRAFGSYLTGPNAALPSLVTDSPHTVVTRYIMSGNQTCHNSVSTTYA